MIIMHCCLMAFLFTAASILPAQAQLYVRLNPGLAAPVGEFGDVAQGGLGGYIGVDLGVHDNLALIATAGFVAFGETRFIDFTGFSEGELEWSGSVYKGGFKYFYDDIGKQVRVYGKFEVGVYRQSARVEPDVGPELEVKSDEFLLSGGIGSEKHFGPVLLGVSGTLNYTPGDFGDVSWVDMSVEVKLPLFGG